MNILINAYSLSTGGGQRILDDFLQHIPSIVKNNNIMIYAFVPKRNEYIKYEDDQFKILELPHVLKKNIMRPLVAPYLKNKIDKLNIDKIFSMGNIALNTDKPQLLLFHWAYAVYPEKEIWSNMDIKSYINRKLRLYLFQKNLKYADKVIVQTENIEQRLYKYYNKPNTVIIPNSIDMDNHVLEEQLNFNLPSGKKLLYLTNYYTHKNLEILIPLAKKIKEQKLDYKIIVTLNKNQHPLGKKFLEKISIHTLEDVIFNIGSVKLKDISSIYKQCDALLMPTLLESFGLTYIEAMHFNLPILTSDRDFARILCKDLAFYFDPLDESSILETIEKVFSNKKNLQKKIEKYNSFFNGFLTSKEVSMLYIEEIIKIK